VLYWLGSYAAGRFDLASAAGPFRLDLGDVLYAPNILTDGQGRQLLWGWLQVRRSGGALQGAAALGCDGA
jgi:beta-fructofuranosidase